MYILFEHRLYKELSTILYMENKNNQTINKWLLPSFRRRAIINKLKKSLGLLCLGIAVFPNLQGFWAYPLGLMLLGLSFKDLENYKRILKCKLRGWL